MMHNEHKIIGVAYNGQILPALVWKEAKTYVDVIGLSGEIENSPILVPNWYIRDYKGPITPEMDRIIESRKN